MLVSCPRLYFGTRARRLCSLFRGDALRRNTGEPEEANHFLFLFDNNSPACCMRFFTSIQVYDFCPTTRVLFHHTEGPLIPEHEHSIPCSFSRRQYLRICLCVQFEKFDSLPNMHAFIVGISLAIHERSERALRGRADQSQQRESSSGEE